MVDTVDQMQSIEGWFVDALQVLTNAQIIADTQWIKLLAARNIGNHLQRRNRIIQIFQQWNPDESQSPIHWYPPGYIEQQNPWNPVFADVEE